MIEEYCTVSEAARLAGTTRKAIRVYEAKGLLPDPERTDAGYRLFTAEDVEVLRFIRRARSLGLSLAEIGEVLDHQRGGARPCGHVIAPAGRPPRADRGSHEGAPPAPGRAPVRPTGS
jgi:DNA-binding transcriptional MerR regulator